MRFFIELQYDGTNYSGWQIQPNANTVQGVLQKSISFIMSKEIKITGASRTDSGVHANQTFAHFDFDSKFDINFLIYRLNSFLPNDINIINIHRVVDEANARFDAEYREYQYFISYKRNPFDSRYSFFVYKDIDEDNMRRAANVIMEYDNFKSFSRKTSYDCSNICKIKESYFNKKDDKIIYFISSNRFLRNMVRSILGNILMVGFGKITIDDLRKIIESKDNSNSLASVPSKGLFLKKIHYPNYVFL